MDKINLHILIPVWGERYLSTFMKTSMAMLLAPGNIPFLARQCRLTAVFLTTAESVACIRQTENFEALSEYCAVEYVTIDDLLVGSLYAVPLTLAFVRGMTRLGQAMTQTYFVFYNADFILADGSMKAVWERIRQGNDIILGTSFRADAEAVAPELRELVDARNAAVPPRELAALALRHRHHSVIARTVNQNVYDASYWNQAYWNVDEQTILARYFLTTLFCFRPAAFHRTIDSFIDYNMIGRFCPDGKVAAIEDSDDFFLLELQSFQQEMYFLKMGTPSARHVAASVAGWATNWHRFQSRFETVIHGGDLPPGLEDERRRFSAFMDDVARRLPARAPEPATHYHWVAAVAMWVRDKMLYDKEHRGEKIPLSGLAVPLVRINAGLERKIRGRIAGAAALLLGVPPAAFPWHPLWENYRALRRALRVHVPKNEELLYITDSFAYDGIVAKHASVTKLPATDVLNGHLDALCPGKTFSCCLVTLEYDVLDVARLLAALESRLHGRKKVLIFWGRTMNRLTRTHFMDVYFHALQELAPYKASISHIGNLPGLTLTAWMLNGLRRVRLNPVWHLPRMLGIACLCLCNNLYSAFLARERSTPGATGVLAVLSLEGKKSDARQPE